MAILALGYNPFNLPLEKPSLNDEKSVLYSVLIAKTLGLFFGV